MKILVTVPLLPAYEKRMKVIEAEHEIRYSTDQGAGRTDVEWADIILGNVSIDSLKEPENLKWIQLNSSGADAYCKKGVLKPGTMLTNATGSYGAAIAEYMLGALLAINGNLMLYRDNQQKHEWKDMGSALSVMGSKALIVGLGDIGGEFAKRLKALGCRVTGVRRNVSDKPDYADEVYPPEQLDSLLPSADVVALCLPASASTEKLMNEDRLNKMKNSAVLINVGRGSAVDTEALCRVLEKGHLRGAALDVTEPEPLPPEHRLWSCPNVFLTPHISGGYHTMITHEKILNVMFKNLELYLKGEELVNQVDFETGYRKHIS